FCTIYITNKETVQFFILALHDALPIWNRGEHGNKPKRHVCFPELSMDQSHLAEPIKQTGSLWVYPCKSPFQQQQFPRRSLLCGRDRKSTRLNSSHVKISYAVFCLKKKK